MGVRRLPLTTAISLVQEQHYTNPMIAEVLGVTTLQVHYYHRGKTKTPNPIVCKALLEGFRVDGDKLLVDIYKDVRDLESHYKVYKERQDAN